MSKLLASHAAQKPLVAEFTWNFDDTMVDTLGVEYALGKDTSSDIIANWKKFRVMKLPVNAVVTGGHIIVQTAFDTAGYDIKVGDNTTEDRYLGSTDIKGTGYTALVPTGYVDTAGEAIQISVQTDDACTTGKARLVVEYIIAGRADEVTAHP